MYQKGLVTLGNSRRLCYFVATSDRTEAINEAKWIEFLMRKKVGRTKSSVFPTLWVFKKANWARKSQIYRKIALNMNWLWVGNTGRFSGLTTLET